MTMDRVLCGICAWRGDCNKKFMHGEGIHCPDYTRDLTIKALPDEEKQGALLPGEKKDKKKSGLFGL